MLEEQNVYYKVFIRLEKVESVFITMGYNYIAFLNFKIGFDFFFVLKKNQDYVIQII